MTARTLTLFAPVCGDGARAKKVLADLEPWFSMSERFWETTRQEWFRKLQAARYYDHMDAQRLRQQFQDSIEFLKAASPSEGASRGACVKA